MDPNTILRCVADKYTVNVSQLQSLSQKQNVVEARFMFFLITRELTGKSYHLIGNYVNRNHCTVIYGARKIRELMAAYPGIKSLYKKIKDEITME